MKSAIEKEERFAIAGQVEDAEFEEMEQGVSEAGMGVMMTLAGLIGVWGLACLTSAMAQNGIMALVRGWWSAVSGM